MIEQRQEQLWTIQIQRDTWSCELVFGGDSWGWEARTLREGKLFISRRFSKKVQATEWAAEMRDLLDRECGMLYRLTR